MTFLDPAVVDEFQRNGVVVVRGLFTPDEVAVVERGIERNLSEPSPLHLIASDPDDPGFFIEDFCNWQRIDEFRQLAFDSRAADVALELMGCTTVRLFHDHTLVKEPGTRQVTPWHQDQPYYNVEGFDNVSMWMPVDPVDREWSLELVEGSHREGWLMPRSFKDAQAKWFPEGTLKDLPDIEANRDAFPITAWSLQPGDAVFFHMLTLHRAGGVPQGHRRRAFSLRFIGDDTTHSPRPWRTSPPFPGLDDVLPAGAPMDHELFPVLRTR